MKNSKLFLKNYWDNAIGWYKNEDQKAIFIENEGLNQILEFISRKNSGSLLVSGQMGSGKTSTVIKAIRESKDKDGIFPVYLNALHLEAVSDKGQGSFLGMMQVLKQLVKALAYELERKNLPKPKQLQLLLTDINATELIWRKKTTTSKGFTTSGGFEVEAPMGPVASLKGDLEALYGKNYEEERVVEKIGLTIEDIIEKFSEFIGVLEEIGPKLTIELRKQIGEMGIYFKLEKKKTVSVSRKKARKIVFVIDELDFYDKQKERTVGPGEILDAIKKFKNLFTLSNAQFIFIVGKNTYEKSIEDDAYKTLFSERVFLAKPDGQQLLNYLSEILERKVSRGLENLWEKQKWLMITKSKHNFFDLVQNIKSEAIFDKEKKKSYINLSNLSGSDSLLIVIHFALNEVYKHHLQNPVYRHFDEFLFDQLYEIEENFKFWIHGEGLKPVALTIEVGNNKIPIRTRGAARSAKKSMIRYLFRLANQEPPQELENPDQPNITIPWDQLQKSLTFDKVRRGVEGPVTDEDKELFKKTHDATQKIKDVLGVASVAVTSGELKALLNQFAESFNVSLPGAQIKEIENAKNNIESKPFYNRTLQESKTALEAMKTVEQILDKIKTINKKIVFRVDWGSVVLDEKGKIIHLEIDASHGNKLLTRITLFPKKQLANGFELSFEIRLSESSLLNTLIGTKGVKTEVEDEFYMLRLDTRGSTETVGDGILLKPENNPNWQYIDGKGVSRTSTKSNRWLKVRAICKKNNLVFSKKVGRKFVKIASLKVEKPPLYIGFGNELGVVEIKNLNIK